MLKNFPSSFRCWHGSHRGCGAGWRMSNTQALIFVAAVVVAVALAAW
jgi:hypothetical protein